MADLTPSLSRAREQKITELSTHFANDDITLEDLEQRIERVYKAASVAELDTITADLHSLPAPSGRSPDVRPAPTTSRAPTAYANSGRILSIMGESRRMGRWQVPQRLDVVSVMSDTKIDLTQAVMPAGIVEIDMRVVWAACKVVVPPGMRVINEMHAIMASVHSNADDAEPGRGAPFPPTIRLTGFALMSEVKVVVRRREDPISDDDED
jgi:uncharacterized protein DUF1707/cell wall-active antibiotic response 4TMS protein YvqF